ERMSKNKSVFCIIGVAALLSGFAALHMLAGPRLYASVLRLGENALMYQTASSNFTTTELSNLSTTSNATPPNTYPATTSRPSPPPESEQWNALTSLLKNSSDDLSKFDSVFIKRQESGEKGDKQPVKLIYVFKSIDWFGGSFGGCKVSACAFTYNASLRTKAEAVLVHACRIGGEPPSDRPPGQIWVAMALESPIHYNAGYRNPLWKGAFNWTMTYRTDSDIFYPYAFLAYREKSPNKDYKAIAKSKTRNAAWFVSNCFTQSKRSTYVKELQKHIDVDIYGKCGQHSCPRHDEARCSALLNSTYRFYLSFENSVCRDYVTEKFYKIFANVNAIPVVRGGADYKKFFPPGTFIDAGDFKTPQSLAAHLKRLASDEDVFAAMLERKNHFVSTSGQSAAKCELCRKLHSWKGEKTYPDLPEWVGKDTCWTPKDLGT
ncbi:hypothetical protein BaRGS_00019343, partial [Batillaria attramentaria]